MAKAAPAKRRRTARTLHSALRILRSGATIGERRRVVPWEHTQSREHRPRFC